VMCFRVHCQIKHMMVRVVGLVRVVALPTWKYAGSGMQAPECTQEGGKTSLSLSCLGLNSLIRLPKLCGSLLHGAARLSVSCS
jgi:hypothetical protein